MYRCPTCHDTFLFRPDPCPTCSAQAQNRSRSRRAKERRAQYDPAGKLATEEFWQVLRWFPCCPCCGRSWPQIEESISQDHIIPISRGGVNTVANLQPLCQPCNVWKRDHLIAFDPQTPGRAAPLPRRLHPLLQQIPHYHPQAQPTDQLELFPFDPHAWSYPEATPAQLQRATLQLTWEQILTGDPSGNSTQDPNPITPGALDDSDSTTDPAPAPPHRAVGH